MATQCCPRLCRAATRCVGPPYLVPVVCSTLQTAQMAGQELPAICGESAVYADLTFFSLLLRLVSTEEKKVSLHTADHELGCVCD